MQYWVSLCSVESEDFTTSREFRLERVKVVVDEDDNDVGEKVKKSFLYW